MIFRQKQGTIDAIMSIFRFALHESITQIFDFADTATTLEKFLGKIKSYI